MGDMTGHDLQSESDHDRITFLRTELASCFILAGVAETDQRTHNTVNAKRSLTNAESGYSTLQRFLSDPRHTKFISDEELMDLKEAMMELREKLDDLSGKMVRITHQDRWNVAGR